MYRFQVVALALAIHIIGPSLAAPQIFQSPSLTLMYQTPQCPGIRSLWSHVYRPERFDIRQSCIMVSGVIAARAGEPDGDLHIRVTLDPQFQGLLNDRNRTGEHGDLVVEPICDHRVT